MKSEWLQTQNQFIHATFIWTTSIYDIIILFQETWWDASVNDNDTIASTYFVTVRKDRSEFNNKRPIGGGVAILTRNEYQTFSIELSNDTTLEWIAVRIFPGKDVEPVPGNYAAEVDGHSNLEHLLIRRLRLCCRQCCVVDLSLNAKIKQIHLLL